MNRCKICGLHGDFCSHGKKHMSRTVEEIRDAVAHGESHYRAFYKYEDLTDLLSKIDQLQANDKIRHFRYSKRLETLADRDVEIFRKMQAEIDRLLALNKKAEEVIKGMGKERSKAWSTMEKMLCSHSCARINDMGGVCGVCKAIADYRRK